MKTKIFFLLTIFFSSLLYSQSTIVYGTGTTIDVGNGADVCAGTITVNGTYSGGGTFCNSALPVELVSFNAMIVKDKVELKWATATEKNNLGFEIQRSSDKQNFVKVGFVSGFGSTTEKHSYAFSDNSPVSGNNFYRLKQIDLDGTVSYSQVVEVAEITPQKFDLSQNFPNPFNPETVISYQIPVSGKASLKIFDMLGREVAALVDEVKEAGTYAVSFNGKAFASGTYFYRFQSGSFVKINKMILMK